MNKTVYDEYFYNRYNGVITKYKKIVKKKYICLEAGFTVDLDVQFMLGKNSDNIIDLIEVGDIVRILLNEKTGATTLFHFESQKQIDILKEANTHIIVSIVTKEQFASMEYKVGE